MPTERMQEIQTALDYFTEIRKEYAKNGAYDTEQDEIIQVMIWRILQGLKPKIPVTPKDWKLYPNKKGNTEAAQMLYRAALQIHMLVGGVMLSEIETRKQLKEFCWRVG